MVQVYLTKTVPLVVEEELRFASKRYRFAKFRQQDENAAATRQLGKNKPTDI